MNIPQQHVCLSIWQCVCWTHLWAFNSSYAFFSSVSFFFALIISTWHHMRTFKHAPKCFQALERFGTLNRTKLSRTKPPNSPNLSISHPPPEKKTQEKLSATCSLHNWLLSLNFYEKFPSDCWCFGSLGPHDPGCSYEGMANGLHLVLFNLLLTTFGQEFCALPELSFRRRESKTSSNDQSCHFPDSIIPIVLPVIAFKKPNTTCRAMLKKGHSTKGNKAVLYYL